MVEEKISNIIEGLRKTYGNAPLELNFSTPLELLVAVILSAQCKDERVNEVTKELFKHFKTPKDLLAIPQEKLEEIIRPTGYYRQKAKTILKCCEYLETHFGGLVPQNIEDLTKLPGVGRKTAAMVLGNAYHINEGIAVDRHVQRVSNRLGLSKETKPEKIEADLMKLIPRHLWTWFSNAMILHGRRICKAQKPLCNKCPLENWCDFRK